MSQTFSYRYVLRGAMSKIFVSRDPRGLQPSTANLAFLTDEGSRWTALVYTMASVFVYHSLLQ